MTRQRARQGAPLVQSLTVSAVAAAALSVASVSAVGAAPRLDDAPTNCLAQVGELDGGADHIDITIEEGTGGTIAHCVDRSADGRPTS